jgi:hypothetical protein
MNSAQTTSTEAPRRRSRWTNALLTVCGLFVLTVFLMIASAFNPNGAVLTRFFDRHGVTALALEVGAILVVAVIVLSVERRESRRRVPDQASATSEPDRHVAERQDF